MKLGGGRQKTSEEMFHGEWFAWYPVKAFASDGSRNWNWVWWEVIRFDYQFAMGCGSYYRYTQIKEKKNGSGEEVLYRED